MNHSSHFLRMAIGAKICPRPTKKLGANKSRVDTLSHPCLCVSSPSTEMRPDMIGCGLAGIGKKKSILLGSLPLMLRAFYFLAHYSFFYPQPRTFCQPKITGKLFFFSFPHGINIRTNIARQSRKTGEHIFRLRFFSKHVMVVTMNHHM